MNHKRGRCKNRRAGCLMCKPNKMNGFNDEKEMGHAGFGKLRRLKSSKKDIKEFYQDEEQYIIRSVREWYQDDERE